MKISRSGLWSGAMDGKKLVIVGLVGIAACAFIGIAGMIAFGAYGYLLARSSPSIVANPVPLPVVTPRRSLGSATATGNPVGLDVTDSTLSLFSGNPISC